jgi:hypothetical protein
MVVLRTQGSSLVKDNIIVVFGLTVSILRTGYPRVQALNQDSSSCLPTEGSSRATTCPRGSGQLKGRHMSLGLYGLQANK